MGEYVLLYFCEKYNSNLINSIYQFCSIYWVQEGFLLSQFFFFKDTLKAFDDFKNK